MLSPSPGATWSKTLLACVVHCYLGSKQGDDDIPRRIMGPVGCMEIKVRTSHNTKIGKSCNYFAFVAHFQWSQKIWTAKMDLWTFPMIMGQPAKFEILYLMNLLGISHHLQFLSLSIGMCQIWYPCQNMSWNHKFVIRCCICIYFNFFSKSLKYVDYGMHARKLDKSKSPSNILCEVPDNLMCQEQFDIVLFADGVCLSEFYKPPGTFGVQIHVARTAKSLSRQIPKVLFKCFHLDIFWMTFCIQRMFTFPHFRCPFTKKKRPNPGLGDVQHSSAEESTRNVEACSWQMQSQYGTWQHVFLLMRNFHAEFMDSFYVRLIEGISMYESLPKRPEKL